MPCKARDLVHGPDTMVNVRGSVLRGFPLVGLSDGSIAER